MSYPCSSPMNQETNQRLIPVKILDYEVTQSFLIYNLEFMLPENTLLIFFNFHSLTRLLNTKK
jgi:hypothetical protein